VRARPSAHLRWFERRFWQEPPFVFLSQFMLGQKA
jgi:hypothetical protein